MPESSETKENITDLSEWQRLADELHDLGNRFRHSGSDAHLFWNTADNLYELIEFMKSSKAQNILLKP